MNVLITGGYGFIGSALVERYYKEGHNICIIDNQSTGRKGNVSVPHKFYQLNVEDKACEEVFRSAGFDIVVHLAAQTSVAASIQQPYTDTHTNVLGLVNMLELSARYGVKKFIFASSAAVYGEQADVPIAEEVACSPMSPYGINKRLGEQYCEKWKEMYNLDTLCLRFSNVYGPRQGSEGEGGVISIFLKHVRDGKQLTVFGDGGQTRDFIYVEDVADAIFRGSMNSATGVYNLSTAHETSVNELIALIRTFASVPDVLHLESRPGEIIRSSLDNSKIKRDFDWLPLYSLQEGLFRTYQWMLQQEAAATTVGNEVQAPAKPKWIASVRPYVENVLAFAVVFLFSRPDNLFFHQQFDFRLIYILLMGLLYGTRQSLLASAAVIGMVVADSVVYNGRDWASLLYDPESLLLVAVYLFFGLAVGFVTDRKNKKLSFAKNELDVEQQRYRLLTEIHKDTRRVKDALQRQVLTTKDSLGRIHSIVSELETLEPEQVAGAAVKVLEDLMETRRISIYSVSSTGYLRLLLQSNDGEWKLPRSIRLADVPELADVVTTNRMWVNKALSPELPLLAAPVVFQGETMALVCVYDQDFERFSLYHENLFKISVDLISSSFSRALTFTDATRSKRYVDDTPILQEAAFQEVLRSKLAAKERFDSEFTLLSVDLGGQDLKKTGQRISRLLRDTDYLGVCDGKMLLLLSNSRPGEAHTAMERLAKNGFATRLVSEEAIYG
ncbi:NAD-dependent epimerase/dehydratase family protein [Brevibacillus brevis]|uniref:NAD-dependent epimerase/dehydratase family protein n=1 Tax=Brevibacillus brevis TaxID=1393 RepID=A0ABY9T343_BREBE|nr:NAD-dependent epimerase/dehydratase family protein [Brevibacillus brevis]WNC13904.1 NAD-dependent epimerase/dehydratase family protein [Brevibacillus brevis]